MGADIVPHLVPGGDPCPPPVVGLGAQDIAVEAEAQLIQWLRRALEIWGQPSDAAAIDALRAVLTRSALATSTALVAADSAPAPAQPSAAAV